MTNPLPENPFHIECRNCSGTGIVIWPNEWPWREIDCPTCEGTGVVERNRWMNDD